MTDLRLPELEVLAESNRLLTSTLDLTEVLDRLAALARIRLDTEVARIWLRSESGDSLRLSAHKGHLRSPRTDLEQVPAQSSLVGWVLMHRRPLVLADVQDDPRLANRPWFLAEGFASLLCVPILLDDALFNLWRKGLVTKEEALIKSLAPDELRVRFQKAEQGLFEDDEATRERMEKDAEPVGKS